MKDSFRQMTKEVRELQEMPFLLRPWEVGAERS